MERAIRTAAQTLIALIGTDAANLISGSTLDWLVTAVSAAVLSVLTSIVAGIPEAPQGGEVGGPN